MLYEVLSYILIGIIAGVTSGLFGISGGIVTIPFLVFLFKYSQEVPLDILMHMAIGTSLASMTFNACSSMYFHNKRKGVVWKIFLKMLPAVIIGSFLGSTIAELIKSSVLKIIFGGFECLVGVYFLLAPHVKTDKEFGIPSLKRLSIVGFIIGTVSTTLGIGGGQFTVPVLSHFKIPMRKCIGTASSVSFVISFFGAIAYLGYGLEEKHVPFSIGYLYLPAFICISLTTLFIAPIGVKLAQVLPVRILKKVFGVLLVLIGFYMVFAAVV